MALRRCRKCRQPVGTGLAVCPHCAVASPTRPDRLIVAVGLLLLLAAAGAWLAAVV